MLTNVLLCHSYTSYHNRDKYDTQPNNNLSKLIVKILSKHFRSDCLSVVHFCYAFQYHTTHTFLRHPNVRWDKHFARMPNNFDSATQDSGKCLFSTTEREILRIFSFLLWIIHFTILKPSSIVIQRLRAWKIEHCFGVNNVFNVKKKKKITGTWTTLLLQNMSTNSVVKFAQLCQFQCTQPIPITWFGRRKKKP